MIDSAVVIVPVRSLAGGKTRLADALSPEQRAELTRTMLDRVVGAALASEIVREVIVVSPDEDTLMYAGTLGDRITPLRQDPDRPGLNAAIAQAVEASDDRGAASVLVLFSDLPLLTAQDVRTILRRDAPVVIAPDRHGEGTNALLLRLNGLDPAAGAFAFSYGPGSYRRHLDEAHRLGLDAATARTTGTSLDLDTPEDLGILGGIDAVLERCDEQVTT